MNTFDKVVSRGMSVSAFLLFALSLAIPSGYSYGSVGMLLCALCGVGMLRRTSMHKNTRLLLAVFLLMGLLWAMAFDGIGSWTGSDLPWKYWLAALTLAVAAAWGVSVSAVTWGVCVGAVGALGIAGYQYLVLGWDKAWGHTNAIQFGGLAMYLGIASWAIALFSARRWYVSALMWLLGLCGVLASLLSETRGAWIVVPLLLASLLLMLYQQGRAREAIAAVVVTTVLIAVAWIPFAEKLEARATLAVTELNNYLEHPEQAAVSSVGQRLEQWRLALVLIEERPVTGWGVQGVIAQKQRLVDQGLAHPSVMEYGHAHNEILDMGAKRGLIGLAVLFLFYGVPLYIFWPSATRVQHVDERYRHQVLAVRASAALLPIAYFGFGWTQVFFAHNSGNMFYLFAIIAFWAAIQQMERTPQCA